MTTVEKILKSHGIITTTEGFFQNTIIIAWDDFGINEEQRFKLNVDLKKVYDFLGY